MKLSVIICVYNTDREKLNACLNSIYSSTLKDFEVILVDDGSDIDYFDIVEKYHPVYAKTSNRGHLAARTYGLMLASGDYVAYLDSDDSVTVNYHAPMIDCAVESQCDIVVNDWAFKTASSIAYCENDTTINSDFQLEGDEILMKYSHHCGKQHAYFVLWNKIFKRELLLKAKEEIEKTDVIMKKMTYSEDMLITFFACKHAKKMKNIHTGYYFYNVHEGQSVLANTSEKIKEQADLITKNFKIMSRSIGENKYAEQIAKNINEWKLMMSRTHYSYAKAQNDDELSSFIKEAYNVENLVPATANDSSDYAATGLLGSNFIGIDNVLRWIYKKGDGVSVNYDKNDKYICSTLDYFAKKRGINVIFDKHGELSIPKREISIKNRILHSKLAYSIGMKLFPKGSKLRNKLKGEL